MLFFDEFKGNNSALSQYLWDTELYQTFFNSSYIYTLPEITIKTVYPIWYRPALLAHRLITFQQNRTEQILFQTSNTRDKGRKEKRKEKL